MKHRILTIILIAALVLSALALFGCNKDTTPTVMTVSLNPSVEFVLDGNGKVVTVSANNEEGNLVISAKAFQDIEGKTAQQAVELFVSVSKETGYLVTGKVQSDENHLEVAFGGSVDKAEQLWADIKSGVDNYFKQNGITASVTQGTITEADIKALVAQCYPYLEEAQLKAMDYVQCVEQIVASRKETDGMYSQEIKNAYYAAKEMAYKQARMDVLKSHANLFVSATLEMANKLYAEAINAMEQARFETLVSETGPYQVALAAFRQTKTEYLNLRNYIAQQDEVSPSLQSALDKLEVDLANAETRLLEVGASANAQVDMAKAQVENYYNQFVQLLSDVNANSYLDEISKKQTEALDTLFGNFEKQYSANVDAAKQAWDAMYGNLKAGYQA